MSVLFPVTNAESGVKYLVANRVISLTAIFSYKVRSMKLFIIQDNFEK